MLRLSTKAGCKMRCSPRVPVQDGSLSPGKKWNKRYNRLMLEFLNVHPGAFGLDISDLSFKISQLKKTRKALQLTSQGEFAIPPGVIEQGQIKDVKQLSALICQAITYVAGQKITTRHVVASLPE